MYSMNGFKNISFKSIHSYGGGHLF